MTCIHAWTLYSHIQASADAYQILMACCNPRNLFVETFLQKLQLEESISILNAKCRNGCSFKVYLSRISNATFNIKAKNIVSIANDNISATKREHADHKRSGIAKKVKKTQ